MSFPHFRPSRLHERSILYIFLIFSVLTQFKKSSSRLHHSSIWNLQVYFQILYLSPFELSRLHESTFLLFFFIFTFLTQFKKSSSRLHHSSFWLLQVYFQILSLSPFVLSRLHESTIPFIFLLFQFFPSPLSCGCSFYHTKTDIPGLLLPVLLLPPSIHTQVYFKILSLFPFEHFRLNENTILYIFLSVFPITSLVWVLDLTLQHPRPQFFTPSSPTPTLYTHILTISSYSL
jgi:hypothetical protein